VSRLPRVSIVTPTFNMAHFLGETIESVLSQDYPDIEYLVMDGGSKDGTLDLLEKYKGRLRWISEPDDGQADAVNKGFRHCTGEIFTFLNADDTYYPGAVRAAVEAFERHPEAAVIYGDAWYTAEDGSPIRRYPVDPYNYDLLGHLCFICQPASFLRSRVFEEMGGLNTSLHLTLDYDLWLRISARYPMVKLDRDLATSRMYADNKTLSRQVETFHEVIQITKQHRRYVPLNWLYGYAGFLLDGKDNFFEISRPSLTKYALTLMLGARYNPLRFHRFVAEAGGNAGLAMKMLWNRWRGRPPQLPVR
jgi:glycosyltransferase involved in cell wall biosynthesis